MGFIGEVLSDWMKKVIIYIILCVIALVFFIIYHGYIKPEEHKNHK